jgi:phage terminase large subunit-like protein
MLQTEHDLYDLLGEAIGDNSWLATARPNQLPPAGEWFCWLLLAGRGFGKTRTLSEFVIDNIIQGTASRVALVGPTAADSRDVLAEGPSGILACSPEWNRPLYEPSKRRLTWNNGAIASLYSADEPERLRGPQHDLAAVDELGSWRRPEAWSNLLFGLRQGKHPRIAVATTPRPTRLIRELVAREGQDVVVTRGTSYDNRENLAPEFFSQITRKYEGTRLGRQELLGELLTDVPGALWGIDQLDALRLETSPPELARIVVAIDPSGTEEGDETGIIAAGVDQDGRGYVLVDASGQYPPTDWAKRAVELYHHLHAGRIVAEQNFGGQMVEATIRAIDPNVSYRGVTASRGKVARAEPIAALFEQRKVFLVGSFAALEDQMTSFTSNFDRSRSGFSPGRVDALVWALTDLMAQPMPGYAYYDLARAEAEGRPILPPGANPLLAVYEQARARIKAGQSPFTPMPATDEPDDAIGPDGKTAWLRRYEARTGGWINGSNVPSAPQPGSREFDEQHRG